MKADDIISYDDIVHAEKAGAQPFARKGLPVNFDLGKGYSVFLTSVRKSTPQSLAS
jgi:hypothetical protein